MSEELIKTVNDLKNKMDKGQRVSGREVTDAYNQVFNSHLPSTNCSSCIRRRISQMFNEMIKQEKQNAQQI